MPAASISDVSTPRRDGETFRLDVPAGWRQGRGAFGGLTIGAAVRAIELRVGDPRRKVRSVTAELPAPVEAGPAEIAVDVLRGGSSVTVARAALIQAGETRAHAVAVLAAPRPAGEALAWRDLEPPRAPPWRDLEPVPFGAGSGPGPGAGSGAPAPEFARHFEYRIAEGLPLTGGDARCVGWIRPHGPSGPRDAGYLAMLADAWYPAVMVRLRELRPMATIAYTLDLVGGSMGSIPRRRCSIAGRCRCAATATSSRRASCGARTAASSRSTSRRSRSSRERRRAPPRRRSYFFAVTGAGAAKAASAPSCRMMSSW